MASRSFGPNRSKKPHLLRAGGVAAEVNDVRRDIDVAFLSLESEVDAISPASVPAGTMRGRQIDALTGPLVNLTGAEQSENWRRSTIQLVENVVGDFDVVLNNDTTVLLIRTTGHARLRSISSTAPNDSGREVVIEHDRQSGTGRLTIPHNLGGSLFSRFFNPDLKDLVLGQTQLLTVRLRAGFWRPQGTAGQVIFPGTPLYDVMTAPFNAVGNGVVDDTAAINAAIAAANLVSGRIYLGPRHLVSAALTAVTRDAVTFVGRGCRGDGTFITATGATPYNVFTLDTVKDCGIQDVFVEGPGTWATKGLGIFIDDCFRTRIERVEISRTNGAIDVRGSVITEIIDSYASEIRGPTGFYAYGTAADGENHAIRFRGCATGTDVSGGTIAWYKQGSGAHTFELINCGALHGGYGLLVVDDTPYAGSSPRFTRTLNFQCEDAEINAIRLTNGATASFTHTLLLNCLGNSFEVDATYSGNWEMNGGMIHGADGHGMLISGDHWSVNGTQIGNIGASQDCISIAAGSTDFSIVNCALGDIFGTNATSRYGINLDATCDRFSIIGNRIIGNDTGAINNPTTPSTTRVIQSNSPTTVNTIRIDEIETMAVGTVVGRRVDAGSTGRPVPLTGAEQAENWRRSTVQTVGDASGTLDIALNNDTTVLLIRTTGDATLRTLGSTGPSDSGREVVIEHDRQSGSGILTIPHNTAGTFSTFFNPNLSSLHLGQTSSMSVRLRSGFWRPQGSTRDLPRQAIISVPVPAVAAGALDYLDVSTVGTQLAGITAADHIVGAPAADLAAAGASAGFYVNCRVSGTSTIRLTFVGTLAGGSVNFLFTKVN